MGLCSNICWHKNALKLPYWLCSMYHGDRAGHLMGHLQVYSLLLVYSISESNTVLSASLLTITSQGSGLCPFLLFESCNGTHILKAWMNIYSSNECFSSDLRAGMCRNHVNCGMLYNSPKADTQNCTNKTWPWAELYKQNMALS